MKVTTYDNTLNPVVTKTSHFQLDIKLFKLLTRVRDNILKSKEQKNIQPTKAGHKMVTCQNYVSLFYCQIHYCPVKVD